MKYNINNNNLYKIFSQLEQELEENKLVINEILKIDYQKSKIKVNSESLKKVIYKLKNENIDLQKDQKIMIIYNGNPTITLNLSILAILTKTTIYLHFNEEMVGINTFIVEIINNILKDFSTNNLIHIVKTDIPDVDKIICIDNINQYNRYLREQNEKAQFYSLDYTDFYCDSEEFDELAELIYKYADENKISIEVYSELNINEAVQMIKNGLGRKVVLLTNYEDTKELFQNAIKDKQLYINQNPFNKEIMIINKKIFL